MDLRCDDSFGELMWQRVSVKDKWTMQLTELVIMVDQLQFSTNNHYMCMDRYEVNRKATD